MNTPPPPSAQYFPPSHPNKASSKAWRTSILGRGVEGAGVQTAPGLSHQSAPAVWPRSASLSCHCLAPDAAGLVPGRPGKLEPPWGFLALLPTSFSAWGKEAARETSQAGRLRRPCGRPHAFGDPAPRAGAGPKTRGSVERMKLPWS